MQSNLECLLERTTPVVPSKILPKSEIRKLNLPWHPKDREEVKYFTLSDLWDSFDEPSVYGVGVPVTYNENQSLVQYYVPYLSAMQIYTCKSTAAGKREETRTLSGRRDSSSDSLSYESESSEKLSRSDGCSSEDCETACGPKDKLGYLHCQYFEYMAPYGRMPFKEKIDVLAQAYPRLMSLRSVDLSPASWMSVFWNPIYHIPRGRNLRDLSTCFLTYHTLSSSFQDTNPQSGSKGAEKRKQKQEKQGEGISLAPFGLSTYKMQGGIWVSDNRSPDRERLSSLFSVADSWLKQLNVQHHDFDFFARPSRG